MPVMYEYSDRFLIGIHQQQIRLAIKAAEDWGYSRPRRWVARFGGIPACTANNSTSLNKEYSQHRRSIEALIPKYSEHRE